MNKSYKSAKSNYMYNLMFQILNVLMPLITAPYVARVIGASGTGIYSYTGSIASYFATVGMLGLTNYGSRNIAQYSNNKDNINKTFSSLFYMQVILCMLMSILYSLYVVLFVSDNFLVAWIQIFLIFASIVNLNWFFWGIEEFKLTVTRSCIVKIITFICVFVFVKNKNDLWKYVFIMSFGTFAGNVPLLFIVHKYVKLIKVSISDIINHFKPNFILFVPILATTLYRSIDKIMLGWLTDYNQVGYYENADKIINICLGCVIALGQVMMPKASNLMANGHVKECNKLVKKSFCFSSVFASAAMFGLLAVSDVFVPVFLGNGFTGTISIMAILSISFVFLAWANVLKTQVLMAREKDNIYVVTTLIGVILNVVLNAMLIPAYKGNGSAFATLMTEAFVFIYIAYKIRNDINTTNMILESLKYLILGAIMAIVVSAIKIILPRNIIGLFILVAIGGTTFIVGCIVLALIFKDELLIEVLGMVRNKIKCFVRK